MNDLLVFALYVLPTNLVLWLFFWFLSRGRTPTRGTRVPQAARAIANRTWGEYHRFTKGAQWESGERELFRTDVFDVSVYSVDRYASVEKQATCILTDHRLVVCDPAGGTIQIPIADVDGAHVYREFSPRTGSSYSVAVKRVGSHVHEPKGDVCLLCGNQEASRELTALLTDLSDTSRPS
ncbi:MAG: hypothetical protein NVS2B16_23530 [Chloroflexota bacterium]